jgi:hypothetical protein
VQPISQIRTIPAALFTSRFAAFFSRGRGGSFLARLLTKGADQATAAEKKNESREKAKEENRTECAETNVGHKIETPLLRRRDAAHS